MADPIPAGDYLIVNAGNPAVALDVSGANRSNGANVQLWTVNKGIAQTFSVFYYADGSARILARFTGKSVDIAMGDFSSGTNIRQWSYNASRAQRWLIEPAGGSAAFEGASYDRFLVKVAASPAMLMEPAYKDAASGRNVALYTDDGGADQKWIFVPVPPLRSGGVYELHSMADARFVVGISSSSKANGANALIWPSGGINDQKFVLADDGGNKWRIRNVNSNKFLDIKGNAARDGASVVQWGEPANVRHQQWKITQHGTAMYNGVECAVVSIGAYGTESDGNTYMMHVYNSTAASGNDVNLWTDGGGAGYRWLLYPVSATDPNMPVPADIALASKVESTSTFLSCAQSASLHPTWRCTQSWTQSGPNHYQVRTRRRYMSSSSSAWLAWSAWSRWEEASCAAKGARAWLADPIDGTYQVSRYKSLQIELQVRCVGVDETAQLVGKAATGSFTVYFKPTFAFPSAGISPQGLRVAYSNDYPCGMSALYIDSATVGGRNALLGGTLKVAELDSEGSFLIPAERLAAPIADGASVSIRYRVGTDQASSIAGTAAKSVAAREDAGSGAQAVPALSAGSGRTLVARVPHIGEERMWLRLIDGTNMELSGTVSGGSAVFEVPYPFGSGFALYTTVEDAGGDRWGVSSTDVPADHPAIAANVPCHAWHWDGGCFLLECGTEPIATERTLAPVYEAHVLGSRRRESVTFAPTVKSSFKASGLLLDHVTESAREQMWQLAEQRHAVYRAPSGEVAEVAVTGLSYRTHREFTEVEVGMVEVTP